MANTQNLQDAEPLNCRAVSFCAVLRRNPSFVYSRD